MNNKYYNSILNFRYVSYTFFVATIIVSFYLEEDSAGGARYDYSIIKNFILMFSSNIKTSYEIYTPSINPHLPFYYIILGKLQNYLDLKSLRYLYALISITLPLIFYNVLKLRHKNQNKNILFLISLIIFLSPYFRSSTIWLTNDNLTLIFLCSSIYFFYKSEKFKNNNFYYTFFCLIFLIFAVYIRQNFILFVFFYIYYLLKNSNNKKIIILLLTSLIAVLPIINYLFIYNHIDYYFSNKQVSSANYSLNLLIFLNIILFYLIPFLVSKNIIKQIFFNLRDSKKKLLLIIFFVLILGFSNTSYTITSHGFGGGTFYKLLVQILDLPFLFIITAVISSILLLCFFEKKIDNLILIVIIFFLYPLQIIYQKYYDPLFLILMFSVMSIDKYIIKNLLNYKFIIIPIIYFASFYLFSLYYYN